MKFLVTAAPFLSTVAAISVPRGGPDGWELRSPTGELVALSGTPEQMLDDIRRVVSTTAQLEPHQDDNSELEKRQRSEMDEEIINGEFNFMCGSIIDSFPGHAEQEKIVELVDWLRNEKEGRPTLPAASEGQASCRQVVCKDDSAIRLCHDLEEEFSLPSYGIIAEAASDLCAACAGEVSTTCGGQSFGSPDGVWNIIVERWRCLGDENEIGNRD